MVFPYGCNHRSRYVRAASPPRLANSNRRVLPRPPNILLLSPDIRKAVRSKLSLSWLLTPLRFSFFSPSGDSPPLKETPSLVVVASENPLSRVPLSPHFFCWHSSDVNDASQADTLSLSGRSSRLVPSPSIPPKIPPSKNPPFR